MRNIAKAITNIPNLWINVGTDSGVRLSTIGSLASGADSSIIGSTLTALKDIVSTEVTAGGETSFMTGETEVTAFGTFAMKIDDETTIIVAYMLSVERGESIEKEVIDLTQQLCINFGRQLTQSVDFKRHSMTGQAVPIFILARAFMNSCGIVRLDHNLLENNVRFERLLEKKVEKASTDFQEFYSLTTIINSNTWIDDEDVWDQGLISAAKRNYHFESFSQEVLGKIVSEDPLAILTHPRPRRLYEQVMEKIVPLIRKKAYQPEEEIILLLPNLMHNRVIDMANEVDINHRHMVSEIIFERISKEAISHALETNPFIGMTDINRYKIKEVFDKLLLDSSIPSYSAGSILMNALKSQVKSPVYEYAKIFVEQIEMGFANSKLIDSVWIVLSNFVTSFTTTKKLTTSLKKLKLPNKEWIETIIERLSLSEAKQLQVDNIEDAAIVSESLKNAILRTLREILSDQFMPKDDMGRAFTNFVEMYHRGGESLRIATLSTSLLNILSELTSPIKMVAIPTLADFLASGVLEGIVKIYDAGEQVKIKKTLFGRKKFLKYGDDKLTIPIFLTKKSDVLTYAIYDSEPMEYDKLQDDPQRLLQLMENNKVIQKVGSIAAERLLLGEILSAVENTIQEASAQDNQIHQIISSLPNKSILDKSIIKPLEDDFDFSIINSELLFGSHEGHVSASLVDAIRIAWQDYASHFNQELEDAPPSTMIKDFSNKIKSHRNKTYKLIESKKNDLLLLLENSVKSISTAVKKKSKEIKQVAGTPESTVLAYQRYPKPLLPTVDECSKRVKRILRSADTIEEYVDGFFVDIFDSFPTDIDDRLYREILSKGFETKYIEEAVDKSETRGDLEREIRKTITEDTGKFFEYQQESFDSLESIFINSDAAVLSEMYNIVMDIGSLPRDKFGDERLLLQLLDLPNITLNKTIKRWNIQYQFPFLKMIRTSSPNIVMFSDVIRYAVREKFAQDTDQVFNGLEKVARFIRSKTDKALVRLHEDLKETIFKR
ncbi:MAG: hypothetical protein ACTSYA_10445 [Candidatus Kariarchaeaceae archaeon]